MTLRLMVDCESVFRVHGVDEKLIRDCSPPRLLSIGKHSLDTVEITSRHSLDTVEITSRHSLDTVDITFRHSLITVKVAFRQFYNIRDYF